VPVYPFRRGRNSFDFATSIVIPFSPGQDNHSLQSVFLNSRMECPGYDQRCLEGRNVRPMERNDDGDRVVMVCPMSRRIPRSCGRPVVRPGGDPGGDPGDRRRPAPDRRFRPRGLSAGWKKISKWVDEERNFVERLPARFRRGSPRDRRRGDHDGHRQHGGAGGRVVRRDPVPASRPVESPTSRLDFRRFSA